LCTNKFAQIRHLDVHSNVTCILGSFEQARIRGCLEDLKVIFANKCNILANCRQLFENLKVRLYLLDLSFIHKQIDK
jgi:hypothetical protein